MNKESSDLLDNIVTGVSIAVTAVVDAAAPEAAPIAAASVAGIKAIISIAEQLGEGDAVRVLLDSELATARQATDAALAAKYPKGA